MKLLELFSGTGSVGEVARSKGIRVVSLDLKDADIECDILEWNYRQYTVGYFDMIWSSPPCIEYSIAKTTGVRKIDEANKIVLKTIEIIEYFKPKIWFIGRRCTCVQVLNESTSIVLRVLNRSVENSVDVRCLNLLIACLTNDHGHQQKHP